MKGVAYIITLILLVCVAYAAPVFPTKYSGKVTTQGLSVINPNVLVVDNENIVVSMSVVSDAEGYYSLYVRRDDPDTQADEGVGDEEIIHFYVDDYLVKTMTIGEPGLPYDQDLDMTGLKIERRNSGGSPTLSFEVYDPVEDETVILQKRPAPDNIDQDGDNEAPANDEKRVITTFFENKDDSAKPTVKEQVASVTRFVDQNSSILISVVLPIVVLLGLVLVLVIIFRRYKR